MSFLLRLLNNPLFRRIGAALGAVIAAIGYTRYAQHQGAQRVRDEAERDTLKGQIDAHEAADRERDTDDPVDRVRQRTERFRGR